MNVFCKRYVCSAVFVFSAGLSAIAQNPAPPTPAEARELYREAAAKLQSFSDKAKAGLASCSTCRPTPDEIKAALSGAEAPLRLLARANSASDVDWGEPEHIGLKNMLSVRPADMRNLGALALLRFVARLNAGQAEAALDDLHNTAILAQRLAKPSLLIEAHKQISLHSHWQRMVARHMHRLDQAALQRVLLMTRALAAHDQLIVDALSFEHERMIAWTLTADPNELVAVGLQPLIVKVYYPQVHAFIEDELLKVLALPADQLVKRAETLIKPHEHGPLIQQLVPGFIHGRKVEYVTQSRSIALQAELLRRCGEAAEAKSLVTQAPYSLLRTEEERDAVWRISGPEPFNEARYILRIPLSAQ